jgi:hypothetical protein
MFPLLVINEDTRVPQFLIIEDTLLFLRWWWRRHSTFLSLVINEDIPFFSFVDEWRHATFLLRWRVKTHHFSSLVMRDKAHTISSVTSTAGFYADVSKLCSFSVFSWIFRTNMPRIKADSSLHWPACRFHENKQQVAMCRPHLRFLFIHKENCLLKVNK